jgi:hypothetical protein
MDLRTGVGGEEEIKIEHESSEHMSPSSPPSNSRQSNLSSTSVASSSSIAMLEEPRPSGSRAAPPPGGSGSRTDNLGEEREDSKDVKSNEDSTSYFLRQTCQICDAPAANHLHYGAFCCYSCRAFFRRSGDRTYKCSTGNNTCKIENNTRKACKKCRYRLCLDAGMKPALVDRHVKKKRGVEEELVIRNLQPMKAKLKTKLVHKMRTQNQQVATGSGSADESSSMSVSPPTSFGGSLLAQAAAVGFDFKPSPESKNAEEDTPEVKVENEEVDIPATHSVKPAPRFQESTSPFPCPIKQEETSQEQPIEVSKQNPSKVHDSPSYVWPTPKLWDKAVSSALSIHAKSSALIQESRSPLHQPSHSTTVIQGSRPTPKNSLAYLTPPPLEFIKSPSKSPAAYCQTIMEQESRSITQKSPSFGQPSSMQQGSQHTTMKSPSYCQPFNMQQGSRHTTQKSPSYCQPTSMQQGSRHFGQKSPSYCSPTSMQHGSPYPPPQKSPSYPVPFLQSELSQTSPSHNSPFYSPTPMQGSQLSPLKSPGYSPPSPQSMASNLKLPQPHLPPSLEASLMSMQSRNVLARSFVNDSGYPRIPPDYLPGDSLLYNIAHIIEI